MRWLVNRGVGAVWGVRVPEVPGHCLPYPLLAAACGCVGEARAQYHSQLLWCARAKVRLHFYTLPGGF